MHFVRRLPRIAAALGPAAALACADGFTPLSNVPPPETVQVEPVRLNAVRLSWPAVTAPTVIGYAIERRANLTGAFTLIVPQVPKSGLAGERYLDTDVEAETYYGYRVFAVTQFGDRSSPSVVGGTRTPPLPGIEIRTRSVLPSAEAADPDGYEVVIAGPDTLRLPVGVSAVRRVSPLRVGTYVVTLGGLSSQCAPDGQAQRTVAVTDTTAQTVVPVTFQVACRDPRRGEITVTVASTGTGLDNTHTIELFGEASDATLPDSLRVVARTQSIGSPSGSTRFVNLHPGTYEITLEGLAANCQLEGARTRTVSLAALANRSVSYAVSCSSGSGGGNQNPGYQYRASWSTRGNDEYALDLRLDMRTFNRPDIEDVTTGETTGDPLTGAQLQLAYDASRVSFCTTCGSNGTGADGGAPPFITGDPTVNGSTSGVISLLAGTTVLRTGDVGIARLYFRRVAGATGSTTTATTLQTITSRSGGSTRVITSDVRVAEGTLTLGSGGGGGTTNQAPVAEANGPYSGTVGTPVTLSSGGSSDSDGSIVSYSWALGNDQTATGPAPQVTYFSPGTYTVTLTVTDDDGASDTDETTVTISGGGGAVNQLPIAEANGPYRTTPGAAIMLSSAGSRDPDGSIASYSWSLGNGQTATGPAPTVTYATAGTYTITLTVIDNRGGTASDQATITVAPPASTKPLSWRNVVGPIDVANNQVAITVTYDMRGNVPETPDIEVLSTFKVDSLKWNPAVMQFVAINLGPNMTGTSNQAKVGSGNLAFQGTVYGAQAQGLITIATIRFRLVGPSGARTTTATSLGPLQGAASTGNFVYNTHTAIVEGDVVVP